MKRIVTEVNSKPKGNSTFGTKNTKECMFLENGLLQITMSKTCIWYLPCVTVLISTVFGMPLEVGVQDGLLAFVLNKVLIKVDFPNPDDPE